jgi:hypothetical protein
MGSAYVQSLSTLLEKERRAFAFDVNREKVLNQLIERIFNPLRTRGTLLKELRIMPLATDFVKEHLIKLDKLGYVAVLPDGAIERVTITPEGLVALAYIQGNFKESHLLENQMNKRYSEFCHHQINRLKKKELLKPKHIAVLLFLLLNGSIGKNNAYKVSSNEDVFCIERIVQCFLTGSISNIEDAYSLRYYLVEAKRILGNVVYNRSPSYFIQENGEGLILQSIQRSIKKDPDFIEKWERLKASYQSNITYLRAKQNSFYSATREYELDRQLRSMPSISGENGE